MSVVELESTSLLSHQQQNPAPSLRYCSRPRSCALRVQVADHSSSIPHESYGASEYDSTHDTEDSIDTEDAIDTVLSTETI